MSTKHHLPCDSCGSSDGMSQYDDGHTWCFVCETRKGSNTMTTEYTSTLSQGITLGFKDRNITSATCKKYGVTAVGNTDKVSKHIYPYTNREGKHVANKVRLLPKTFAAEGSMNNKVALFGQDKFEEGGRAITIYEGELDAMAGFQLTGSMFPCVSLPNGANSAVASIKHNLEYLESFSKIVLCFDNDDAGKKAVADVVSLFSVGKVSVMKLDPKMKDACDYLMANDAAGFTKSWHRAQPWTPDGIICSSDMMDLVMEEDTTESVSYPWEGLNKLTYGIRKSELVMFTAKTGIGKCLHPDTDVMLFNGLTKKAKDIETGETLMGDDSTPRKVLSTCEGFDTMYKIIPNKGEPYIVNSAHILSLIHTSTGEKVDIPVTEYLSKGTTFRRLHKGYRAKVDTFATQGAVETELRDPYVLGVWLGDGSQNHPEFTSNDKEVRDYLFGYASNNGLRVSEKNDITFSLVNKSGKVNVFTSWLRSEGVFSVKRIPHSYKTASREVRLKLLAGILDADGSLSSGCYDIVQKREDLANDIVYVARSLGLAAYVKKTTKCCDYLGSKVCGEYHRVTISGDVSEVPCILPRKKADKRLMDKDVLRVGFKIEKLDEGKYNGFTLDGNRRFLLGDFTVTHNTQILRELIHHIHTESPEAKIGTLFLEEQPKDSALGLMSIEASIPFHLPDSVYSVEDKKQARSVISDGSFYFYENFGEHDVDKLLNRIRYYAKGLDCDYIVLDHISIMVSGGEHGDERKTLDEITTKLKKLTIELNVAVLAVVHLNRQGQIRGTAGVEQLSNIVVHLDRDNQADTVEKRNTTKVSVWKNRFSGKTGVGCYLLYDEITGRLNEVPEPVEDTDSWNG